MSQDITIATLGSHSALQILKGAKEEGFRTLVIATSKRASLYERFEFIDQCLEIPSYSKFSTFVGHLDKKKVIIIPHGTFVAHLGINGNREIDLPYYGSRAVLEWEADRYKQRQWLKQADILLPRQFSLEGPIEFPVIAKSFGAAGGKGYFLAKNKQELKTKLVRFKDCFYLIQEYVVGVTLYIHYFYSELNNRIEILGMDRRYETNVDGIGRIPALDQVANLEPSFVVVGNMPVVLRESLLAEAYRMGESVVSASKKIIDKRGLYGPFCLELVITPDQKMYCIEMSCRIVAGTNLFMRGSPYSWLLYDEPMSMGRRIAREIKEAIKKNQLSAILD